MYSIMSRSLLAGFSKRNLVRSFNYFNNATLKSGLCFSTENFSTENFSTENSNNTKAPSCSYFANGKIQWSVRLAPQETDPSQPQAPSFGHASTQATSSKPPKEIACSSPSFGRFGHPNK